MIPESPADLTPDWMAGVLGTPVRSIRIEDRAAGGIAVTSVVSRVLIESETGPPSVVVKLANPEYTPGPKHYAREVLFYGELAGDLELAIPRCFAAEISDDATRFVLVLEDYTDRAVHPLDGLDLDGSRAMVRAIAEYHATWWQSPRLAAMEGWTRTYTDERIEEIATRCAEAWPRLLEAGTYEVPEKIREVGADAIAGLPDDLVRFNEAPRTLIHLDPHVENIMLDDAARVIFLDWQNACYGSPTYDLCYAVGGNTRPDVLAGHAGDLLDEYHRILADRRIDVDLRSDWRAAIRWSFAGQAWFLTRFEPETEHDRETLTREWERISAALLSLHE